LHDPFDALRVDAVFLHPEDVFIAAQKKPSIHILVQLSDVMPDYSFNSYGAADSMITSQRDLLRDTMAAMIEANRAVYREPQKVIPIIMEATQKPRDAVEYAIGVLTKNCILSVNDGFDQKRTDWTMQHIVDVGEAKPEQKLAFDQLVDIKLAKDAVEAAGGRVTINDCTL
jgi:ABC-type nitrate/sulfonate/bicarbonate transport system substrate-binding protein